PPWAPPGRPTRHGSTAAAGPRCSPRRAWSGAAQRSSSRRVYVPAAGSSSRRAAGTAEVIREALLPPLPDAAPGPEGLRRRRTRAIAVLRRPTALAICCSANLDVPLLVEGDAPGRLRLVLVGRARVDPQPLEHLASQRVVLEHPAHRVPQGERGVELLLLPQAARAQTAPVARVPRVRLVFVLR